MNVLNGIHRIHKLTDLRRLGTRPLVGLLWYPIRFHAPFRICRKGDVRREVNGHRARLSLARITCVLADALCLKVQLARK